jgi:hypothetical protein
MSRSAALLVVALVAAACGSSSPSEDSGAGPAPTSTTSDAPTSTNITDTRISVVGPEEMVFDWTTDRCEDEHIPDISARAIRNADGLVQLYVTHYVTYRMTGTDLNTVTSDCATRAMASAFDPDPSQYNEAGWIAAPYTDDGETVYAVVHNEYRGFVFEAAEQCPLGDYLSCIDVNLTMSISTDGGATFDHIAAPPNISQQRSPTSMTPKGCRLDCGRRATSSSATTASTT